MRTFYVVAFSGLGAVMVGTGLVRGCGIAVVVGSMFVAVGLSLWRLSSRHGRVEDELGSGPGVLSGTTLGHVTNGIGATGLCRIALPTFAHGGWLAGLASG
jgi:hypothetical protein